MGAARLSQLKQHQSGDDLQFVASIFTVAKGGAVAGVAALAEAGDFGSIQGLACGELVTGIADVRERAWIHETGEPCWGTHKDKAFVTRA